MPKDVVNRQKWISALKLHESDIPKSFRICSLHFTDTSYATIGTKRRRLRNDAVPILLESTDATDVREHLDSSGANTSVESIEDVSDEYVLQMKI